ncbi:MAG: Gfo/Idh/MocA family oxidoreductase [Gemmatimonadota bacterium]
MTTELIGPEPRARSLSGSSRPRLGFLGVGWIGRNRLEAIAASGIAEVAAIADSSDEICARALEAAPDAAAGRSLHDLLAMPLDGIVIATPSALHAEQSIAALARGMAVFCQKPLGRTADETRHVVEAARRADRLLGVDLSYRFAEAFARARGLIASGELGEIFDVDLVFHNAYGPDKPWFYDVRLAGGGCVVDLGLHLVDMGLWCLGFPDVEQVQSRLLARGKPILDDSTVEDFATARIDVASGASLRLACSWNLPAGQDAVIAATFYGSAGAVDVRNVDGSFYDFVAERFDGTSRQLLAEPPDAWGGRAAVDWARRLADGATFDDSAEELIAVAQVLDRIYGR